MENRGLAMKLTGMNAFGFNSNRLNTQNKPVKTSAPVKRANIGGMSVSSFVNLIRSTEEPAHFNSLNLNS